MPPAQSARRALGRTIYALRKARGLSQERLGELADTHRNQIGAIERGEASPTFDTLERIACVLDMTTSSLIAQAERESRENVSAPPTP